MEIVRFKLEDFFDQYEHKPGLINLASSDALPWKFYELLEKYPQLDEQVANLSLSYPDASKLTEFVRSNHCDKNSGRDVLITSGSSEGIFLACALVRASHHQNSIGVPKPGYGSFQGISSLLGIQTVPYHYDQENNWQLNRNEFSSVLTKCDAIIINDPHNPTGSMFDSALLKEACDVAERGGKTLIYDHVFRSVSTPPSEPIPPDAIEIGGLSKMYGFPGLRCGWVVAPESSIQQMRTIQQYLTLAQNSFSVVVAEHVLSNLASYDRFAHVSTNRTIVSKWARINTALTRVERLQGGTTAVIDFTHNIDEQALMNACLDRELLIIPGRQCFEYGERAWLRLGYGGDTLKLNQGLKVLTEVVREL